MSARPYEKQVEIYNDYVANLVSIQEVCRKHKCGWAEPFRIYKRFNTKVDPLTGKKYLDTSKMRAGGKRRHRLGQPNFGKRKGILKR